MNLILSKVSEIKRSFAYVEWHKGDLFTCLENMSQSDTHTRSMVNSRLQLKLHIHIKEINKSIYIYNIKKTLLPLKNKDLCSPLF